MCAFSSLFLSEKLTVTNSFITVIDNFSLSTDCASFFFLCLFSLLISAYKNSKNHSMITAYNITQISKYKRIKFVTREQVESISKIKIWYILVKSQPPREQIKLA